MPKEQVAQQLDNAEIARTEAGILKRLGLVVVSPQDVQDSTDLDPKATFAGSLDLENKKSKSASGSEPIYIEFEPGNKRDPQNFSLSTKWVMTALACYFTTLSFANAGSYNMGFSTMISDLNCTEFQATLGLSLHALGFGLIPLVTASFSEEFGRRPLYVISMFGFMMMYIMIAKAHNIETVLVARFIQAGLGSIGSTMVGGTVVDIWRPDERGFPMALVALVSTGGIGFGPFYGGWIQINQKLGWRWIQWIQMMNSGLLLILLFLAMKETRSSIILMRLVKRVRKETGNSRYRTRVEDERAKLSTLIYISCTRPVYLIFTEPVVASFSLWIGFAWGILYYLLESVGPLFEGLHGFSIGQVGTLFLALVIGSTIGFITNFIQERLYQKGYPRRGPEARLYLACVAAVMFPTGMFIYAWTSLPHVPWVGPAIGLLVFIWSCYTIFLAVTLYLADCYGPFTSSALAGQNLSRNLCGFSFPLFTPHMFRTLSFEWSSTIFACIAVLMIPIPFVLFFYGPKIRQRSRFSKKVMETQDDDVTAATEPEAVDRSVQTYKSA